MICYIYQDVYPWDVRVEKIIKSISKVGIESHIISKNNGRLLREEILYNNIIVHRLPSSELEIVTQLMNFPMFFSPIWFSEIFSFARKKKPHLIIVRDLPLAPTALLVSKLTGIPILMDMAENYREMIRDTWNYRGVRILDYFIRNPNALKILEKITVPRMSGILVVSKYSAERVEGLGIDKTRIWVVGNTPDILKNDNSRISEMAKNVRNLSGFVLLYVGGLEESRGLDVVIKAMPSIIKKKKDVHLVIVGSGSAEMKLKKLADQLNIMNHVHFLGWIDNIYIHSIIENVDICIVPHYVTEHTNTTVPNKIFDYMLHKKPIIVTNAVALEDIVLTCMCGEVYEHKNPIDFAKKVLDLDDVLKREKLGLNGYFAVIEQYNWDKDEKVLLDAISKLTGLLSSP